MWIVQLPMNINLIKRKFPILFSYLDSFYRISFFCLRVFGFTHNSKASMANMFYPNITMFKIGTKANLFKSESEDHFLNMIFEPQ